MRDLVATLYSPGVERRLVEKLMEKFVWTLKDYGFPNSKKPVPFDPSFVRGAFSVDPLAVLIVGWGLDKEPAWQRLLSDNLRGVSIPINHDRSTRRSPFVARIFTHEEVGKFLSLADSLPSTGLTPKRHLIMPEIYRLLYCCGLRSGEVVRLRVKDVDLDRGVLIIRDTKFGKDRLAPLADSMTDRLRAYASKMGERSGEDFFFPSPYGGRYSHSTIYWHFREMLWKMNISHQGRGRGPRLHDLRHTFAVHRLAQWIHEGADLNVKLPILATYMGHHKLAGTQKYLQLTADMFPDITAMFEKRFGYVFQGRCGQ